MTDPIRRFNRIFNTSAPCKHDDTYYNGTRWRCEECGRFIKEEDA